MAREQPLTKLLLLLLSQIGQPALDWANFLYDLKYWRGAWRHGGHANVQLMRRLTKKKTAEQALRILAHNKYIVAHKIGKRLIVSLTEKGHLATLAAELKTARALPRGVYTIVIFDVPESERFARRQLRSLLATGGFTKFQKSVWGSTQKTADIIATFVHKNHLGAWVNVFEAKHLLKPPD